MLQNTSKTLGFQKIMVYKTPPGGGEVNHIWLVAYICFTQNISLIGTVVLEKKSFERFLPYMGMAAILNFERQFF